MRYRSETKGVLKNTNYEHLRSKHDRERAIIFRTVDFGALKNQQIQVSRYGTWNVGSSLFKIAFDVYGRTDYWWVIGMVNAKPTDAHFSIGDEIYYPVSPTIIINSVGSQNG